MSGTTGRPVLEVVDPGILATVQDFGRPGLGALGIPAGGAADPLSLEIANLLLGNDGGAAALEITIGGAAVRALERVTVAIAGGDLDATAAGGTGTPVRPGETVTLDAGDVLRFGGRRSGARAYLALPGGVAVPPVLGSRSTDTRAGFGGFEGRPLAQGDAIEAHGAVLGRPAARWSGPDALPRAGIRVAAGPHADLAGEAAVARLAATTWTIGAASDRMGLRLDGDPLPAPPGEMPTLGVLPGAIQLPPDGRPIILLADCQPTGGYPVIAVVAGIDRAALGQLAPGDRVAFEAIDLDHALALARRRHRDMEIARAHLHDAAGWDALWHGAGG